MKNLKQQFKKQNIKAASFEFVIKSKKDFSLLNVSPELISLLGISEMKALWDAFNENSLEKIRTSIQTEQTSFQIQSSLYIIPPCLI